MQRLFGSISIHPKQVFYESTFCYGIVNIKPLVPGHVLLISKRVVPRVADLTAEEMTDLFLGVHHVGPILEKYFVTSALNIAIQDGRDSGQSVPHVHVHILPRKENDFKRNDDVYEELDKIKLNPNDLAENDSRVPRNIEQMWQEASKLRLLFPQNLPDDDLN